MYFIGKMYFEEIYINCKLYYIFIYSIDLYRDFFRGLFVFWCFLVVDEFFGEFFWYFYDFLFFFLVVDVVVVFVFEEKKFNKYIISKYD